MDYPGQSSVPFVMLEEFLVAEEWAGLIRYSFDNGDVFTASSVVGEDNNGQVDRSYRRSRVLFDIGHYRDIFVDRIMTHLPRVLPRLGYEPFPIHNVEIQLTATENFSDGTTTTPPTPYAAD
jgi:hypothetical protein